MSNPKVPRGVRNNNPGNIEGGDPWQGLMPPEKMNEAQRGEKRFCVFVSPKWGVRAIARILTSYHDRHGITTIKGAIERWAPAMENDTNAYIRAVENKIGTQLKTDYNTMEALVSAIIVHECGYQPYPPSVITAGLVLAGYTPPDHGLSKSGTVKGGQVAIVGTVLQGIGQMSDAITVANPAIQQVLQFIQDNQWVAVALILSGVGYMIWRRIDDRRKGLR